MLVYRDKDEVVRKIELILDRSNINLEEYRKEHNIPDDYKIELVHTDENAMYNFMIKGDGKVFDTSSSVMHPDEYPDSDELVERIREVMNNTAPTFYEVFSKFCSDKHMKESDVYNRAGIDRRYISRVRNGERKISKDRVFALAAELRLWPYEMHELLNAAGHVIDKSDPRDLVIDELFLYEKKGLINFNDILYRAGLEPLDTGE